MAEVMQRARAWRRLASGFMIVGAPLLLLGVLTLVAISPIPMRGAEMFGGIAKAIKGHPGATAYWALGAGVGLWLVVGGMVVVQEWRGGRGGAA